MLELSQNQRLKSHSTPARIEIRGGLHYSNLATDDPIEENIDHRILRCQHPRLRAALQFNNQTTQAKVVRHTPTLPAQEEQQAPRVDPEISTGAKALIKVTRMVYNCVHFLMSPI